MAEQRICARCGAVMRGLAAARLCPRCLLRDALPSNPVPDIADHSPELGAVVTTSTSLPLPHSLGDYELLGIIARGGMGIVYKARQKSLNRVVAIKTLLSGQFAEPKFVERFRAEAEAVAQLQHPNIVAIHEIGECEGQPFFSMDYVEGKNLAQVSAGFGPRGVEFHRCAQWLRTIAEAVHYAHQRGIIHRDLKPSNILIDSFDQPRITDFGLAKRLTADSDLTMTGQVLGSPHYLPPEQAAGKLAGVGSDVYALGAILYHLLTGRPPFQAESLATLLKLVQESEPVAPRLLNPSIPRDLETICLKCLDKEIGRRYQTAGAVAEDLHRFLEDKPIFARPTSAPEKVCRWCRRQPVRAGLVAAVVLLFLLGSFGMFWQSRQSRANELFARQNAYAADMNLVQRALADGNIGQAKSLLSRHRPTGGQRDLRGWEWRYFLSLCQGDERSRLARFSKPVCSLAFAPDGQLLAVGLEGGPTVLWDPSARRQVAEFPGLWVPKGPLAFSPGGDLFAWGGWANKHPSHIAMVGLWDLNKHRETTRFLHEAEVLSIAFSPDGRLLAVLWRDGTLHIREVASDKLFATLSTPPQDYAHYGCVRFSPNGRLLAIGECQGRVRLWNCATHEETFLSLPKPVDGVNALAFSPDSRLLAVAGGYWVTDIYLWELNHANDPIRLSGHKAWVSSLAFSPDGSTLASASSDQTIRLWNLRLRTESRRFQGHTQEVWALDWSPDGSQLVSGSEDGVVNSWDPQSSSGGAEAAVLPVPVHMFGFAFSPDGNTFVTASPPDGSVTVWNLATLQPIEALAFVGTNQMSVAVSPGRRRLLATGDASGRISVWDLASRCLITNLVLDGVWYSRLQFSPRGNFLCCVVFPRPGSPWAKIWRTADWTSPDLQDALGKDIRSICLSPNENVLAAGVIDGKARWYNLRSRAQIESFHSKPAEGEHYVAFSPDGDLFASCRAWGQIGMWHTRTLKQKFTTSQSKAINALAFSPDSTRIVTSSSGGADALKIWDAETGRDLCTLSAGPGIYYSVSFSPDNRALATVSTTGTTLLWRAPSGEDLEPAE